jgi:nitroimidazol reductase NimA-like FMN-containing flavoprotein (pyridoxamine 5'-phosphate oxidase superfamily)
VVHDGASVTGSQESTESRPERRHAGTSMADSAQNLTTPSAEYGIISRKRIGGRIVDSLIEDLAESECLELLKTHHFGRVAFVEQADGPPVIMPVNYLVHAETVVVRTDPRSKLGNALRDAPVSFEIDGIDQRERRGWSVVVSGRAQQIVDLRELEELHQIPLLPWAPGDRSQYVRITPELVTGRRISVEDLPSNWWG